MVTAEQIQEQKRKNLKAEMKKKVVDQRRLAELTGIHETTISQMLSGKLAITDSKAVLFAKALKIHPGFIHNIPIPPANAVVNI